MKPKLASWTFFLMLGMASSTALADASDLRFDTLLGFTLNAANLSDVTNRLGPAKRFEVPDGHHETAVCYRLAGSDSIVLFSTDGEFGGSEAEILGLSIQQENPDRFPCSSLKSPSQPMSLDGLHLGITEAQFRKAVGGSVEVAYNGDLVRTFESERTLSAEELERISADYSAINERPVADVVHRVWARFRGGKLVALGCWRYESL